MIHLDLVPPFLVPGAGRPLNSPVPNTYMPHDAGYTANNTHGWIRDEGRIPDLSTIILKNNGLIHIHAFFYSPMLNFTSQLGF